MSVVTAHQTDLTTFCKFKREHMLRRALHLSLNPITVERPATAQISLQQRKVLIAIRRCRTGELGHVIFECAQCHHQHWVGRSCGKPRSAWPVRLRTI